MLTTSTDLLCSEDQFEKWRDYPCFLEVDLEYPDDLHDLHNDYPIAPERMKIGKVDKLICNLNDKERYVVHHKTLKFHLKLGLKLKKIHRGIEFDEEDWLKPYIAKNTEEREKVKSKSEKNFFKLMNNAVFGKTMENVRNRVDERMSTSKKQINNLAKRTNYQSFNIMHLRKPDLSEDEKISSDARQTHLPGSHHPRPVQS